MTGRGVLRAGKSALTLDMRQFYRVGDLRAADGLPRSRYARFCESGVLPAVFRAATVKTALSLLCYTCEAQ